MERNIWLVWAALLGACAVILGAFGAHGLEKLLEPDLLARYHTGIEYQFYHVGALSIVAMQYNHKTSKALIRSGICFIVGIFLFSGSLYLYAITHLSAFGMITPVGGLCFILGWLLLAWHAFQPKE